MILGKKVGMTQIFENEQLIPVTVIEAGTNFVTQIKTVEKEGYNAITLAYGDKKEKNIKDSISDKDKKLDYVRNYIAELVESNRAVIYERKTKKEIKNIVKIKYNNNTYYDAGRGSNYDGYKFYTDKSLSQEIMKFDIITQFGIAIHSSLGDNPYNRELTEKEKEYREKNGNHFEELKELYKKAVQNPNIEQKISY